MLDDLISSVVQALLFILIPFLVWLIAARKKQSFFARLGLKTLRSGPERFLR